MSTPVAATSARERIAFVLGQPTCNLSFSVRRSAPASSLKLEVKGLGELPLPVPETIAEELCRIARPARLAAGRSGRCWTAPCGTHSRSPRAD